MKISVVQRFGGEPQLMSNGNGCPMVLSHKNCLKDKLISKNNANHQSAVFVVALHGPTLVENALPKDSDVITVSSTIILQEFVNQETEDKLKILPMLSKALPKIPNSQAMMRIVQTATSIASTYMQPT